jgi:hypothetical protein
VQPRELLYKMIQHGLAALKVAHPRKIKPSYWQEFAPGINKQGIVLRSSSFVEHRDRPGFPHSPLSFTSSSYVRVDFLERRFKLFLAIARMDSESHNQVSRIAHDIDPNLGLSQNPWKEEGPTGLYLVILWLQIELPPDCMSIQYSI